MYAIMNNISQWLTMEIDKRDWSQAELSRRAGVSRAAISDIISGKRKVGRDLAIALSEALNVPIEDVFRATGDLPAVGGSPLLGQITHLSDQLDEEEQQGIIEYIKMRLKLKRGKSAKTVKPAG